LPTRRSSDLPRGARRPHFGVHRQQRLPGPDGSLAQFPRRDRYMAKPVNGNKNGSISSRGVASGQKRAVEAGPTELKLRLYESAQGRCVGNVPFLEQLFEAPGKGGETAREKAVSMLQNGEIE